jgi:pimeloyl-ACP methyl ester carboxylesterase
VAEKLEAVEFTALGDDRPKLAGERLGDGPPVVALHGLTATRRYVVHGSKALARAGVELIGYDARGHGQSEPASGEGSYGYPDLVGDLIALIDELELDRPVLAGHSMGAHTAAAAAIAESDRFAGLVLICPAFMGDPPDEEALRDWDDLAAGLEGGGVEGFLDAYERQGLDPEWRETLLRIARERLEAHRHPEAVAQALRETPRSLPFEGLGALERIELPALVIASRDEADPSHPYEVGEAWAERLPHARFLSEDPGESPLAWQGGKLSREIAAFCEESAVAEHHG